MPGFRENRLLEKRMKKVYALGFFDGVHLGHQALLNACCAMARQVGGLPSVVTFGNHPDALVFGKEPALINTWQDRMRLFENYGIRNVEILPFDRKMMTMPWRDFFALLRTRFQAEGLVCGNDFCFGYRGEGTPEKLMEACRETGIPCEIVPEQTVHGIRISSTHIRSLLEQGEMEEAVSFLGHPHMLTGKVIHGKQLGRTIGIPTANLELPDGLVVPRFGVYACRALVEGEWYPAVTNVGVRPTVSGSGITVEPWILNYEGDLYDQQITLEFYRFLRPERKFPSLEELKQEICKNAEQTLDYVKSLQMKTKD